MLNKNQTQDLHNHHLINTLTLTVFLLSLSLRLDATDTTCTGMNNIEGGNDPGTLDGTDCHDLIYSISGQDTVNAGQGDDFISAPHGTNNLNGGPGNDTILISHGLNTIDGGEGIDSLYFEVPERPRDSDHYPKIQHIEYLVLFYVFPNYQTIRIDNDSLMIDDEKHLTLDSTLDWTLDPEKLAEIRAGWYSGQGDPPRQVYRIADSDGDGVNDNDEVAAGTAPIDLDSDGDGLSNLDEVTAGTDPLLADSDGDGVNDGDEVEAGTDPLRADSDGDGVDDESVNFECTVQMNKTPNTCIIKRSLTATNLFLQLASQVSPAPTTIYTCPRETGDPAACSIIKKHSLSVNGTTQTVILRSTYNGSETDFDEDGFIAANDDLGFEAETVFILPKTD